MKISNPDLGKTSLSSWLVVMMDNNTGRQRRPHFISTPIMEWLHSEASYCLDAPDNIPGGSCYNDVSDTPKGVFKSFYQTSISRDTL